MMALDTHHDGPRTPAMLVLDIHHACSLDTHMMAPHICHNGPVHPPQ